VGGEGGKIGDIEVDEYATYIVSYGNGTIDLFASTQKMLAFCSAFVRFVTSLLCVCVFSFAFLRISFPFHLSS